jgi:prevent-host-death family protein
MEFFMERKLGVTEAREKFKDIVDQVQYRGDTYIISKHGKPAAAVVPVEVYENWKNERKAFFDVVREIQSVNADVNPEQVWNDVLSDQQDLRSS